MAGKSANHRANHDWCGMQRSGGAVKFDHGFHRVTDERRKAAAPSSKSKFGEAASTNVAEEQESDQCFVLKQFPTCRLRPMQADVPPIVVGFHVATAAGFQSARGRLN